MDNYILTKDLPKLAVGLNIEGYHPTEYINKETTDWINIIQSIDLPLENDTFDMVMKRVRENNYDYIEQAVGIDIDDFIDKLTKMVLNIKKRYKNPLIHVHQYVGTTVLDKTLFKTTGVFAITDKTNFFETPVNYIEKYPDVDCVISISQCAGLGVKNGTWIIPTGFMNYDVVNNFIETEHIYVKNVAKDFVEFEYIEGDILVVNDLWNPTDLSKGVLLLDKKDMNVLNFVKENTKIFDESHDWRHAIKVACNSMQICWLDKIYNDKAKHILYLSLLHDVCDHKYKDSIPREMLTEYIATHLEDYREIDEMIEQISFSKQKSFDRVNPVLEVVRDGDRIEAIGQIGIERCETFVKSRNGVIPDDVIVHCYEKLLRLYPEGYIVTDGGKTIAKKHHNCIVDYVIENLPKTTLDYPLVTYV